MNDVPRPRCPLDRREPALPAGLGPQGGQLRIARKDRHFFQQALGGDHPVERVPVFSGKEARFRGMGSAYR